jgi:hypothetical protein
VKDERGPDRKKKPRKVGVGPIVALSDSGKRFDRESKIPLAPGSALNALASVILLDKQASCQLVELCH